MPQFKELYNPILREQKEIVVTNDGSCTLYSAEFDECYHSSSDGALNESLQKHVLPAFKFAAQKEKLTILDICYGLGFNTLATLWYHKQNNLESKLHIIAPELDRNLVESLKNFSYPKEFESFRDIIKMLSKEFFYEDKQIKIEILLGDAREEIKKISSKIDIIYQDAFSPKKNPALWTYEWFRDLKQISSEDALLTTYSIATPIRLGLFENGFRVYEYKPNTTRKITIASLKELPLDEVDMKLKLQRNPSAKALIDSDLIQ